MAEPKNHVAQRAESEEYQRGYGDCRTYVNGLLEAYQKQRTELEESLLFMKQQRSIAEESASQWEGNYIDLRAETDVLEERVEQLEEALEHSRNERVRLESWLIAMREFVPDDIHYADMAYKGAVERALSGEHLRKEEDNG